MRFVGMLLLVAGALVAAARPAHALELPPTCALEPLAPDETTPIAELKRRVEAEAESDPAGTVKLMCATIPRVAREYGEQSVELAWWAGALAMPLIAYMDKHAEAEPLLEFAGSVLEERLGPEAEELADIHVAHGWIYFRQGRLAEARPEWEAARRIRERAPGKNEIELQKVLVGLGHVYTALRDFAAARLALERAQGILERHGEQVSEAAAAIENALTNIALREEDYAAARRHAEAQIEIEQKLPGGAPQLVPAYALLGQVLERLDELEESERALREAVRLAESKEGPLQRHHLAALTQLASLLGARGKPEEALEVATQALEVGEATLGADAPRLVGVLRNAAEAQRALGHLPEALHLYERTAGIVERHHDDVERQILVAYRRGLGALELNLGDLEAARATLETGLAEAGEDATLSTERAGVLVMLAGPLAGGDADERRLRLTEALELFRARLPNSHPTILRVINELCALELETHAQETPDCTEAARRLETAREVEPALRQAVYDNLSQLAELRGEREEAYTLAVRAVAAAAALGTPDPSWRAFHRLSRLLYERNNAALAIFFGKQSIAEIERLRGDFVGRDSRLDQRFLADKAAVYRLVADWLMEAGRLDEGLAVLRLLKTEELYDFVLRSTSPGPGEGGVELSGEERVLRERYLKALAADRAAGAEIARLGRLRESGRISVKERERLGVLLEGQHQVETSRAERIESFIARTTKPAVPPESSTRTVEVQSLARERERFGPDATLASYLLTESRLRVLVATRAGQFEHAAPVDSGALKREIGLLLDGISRREDVRDRARALYSTIARPVDEAARAAGAKRLVLGLDGALRYVPFAALDDGAGPLVARYAIETYAPAGKRAAAVPPPERRTQALSVRGLGVTRAVAGFKPLPGVADELCSVVRGPIAGLESASAVCPEPETGEGALPGLGFADAAFTAARFETLFEEPREFSVLHLGTHFSLRPGNALRSFLVLGDGSKLTLDRLSQFDFSGVELVTLSACETGLGGAIRDDGREVEGLSAIVERRGAAHVVASLWQVEDASTAQLMQAMYRALGPAADLPRALQQAQLSLAAESRDGHRPYEHPYYWAGFVASSGVRSHIPTSVDP